MIDQSTPNNSSNKTKTNIHADECCRWKGGVKKDIAMNQGKKGETTAPKNTTIEQNEF